MTPDEIKALEGQRVRLRWTSYRIKGARWRRWIWARWPRLGRWLTFRPRHYWREGVLGVERVPGFSHEEPDLYLLKIDGHLITVYGSDVEAGVLE